VLHPLHAGIIMMVWWSPTDLCEGGLKLPLIPASADKFVGFFAGQNDRHLQRKFSVVLDQDNYSSLFVSSDDVHRARLLSVSNRPAGLWLSTLPTTHDFALSDNHFQSALRLRLGLKQHSSLSGFVSVVRVWLIQVTS
jgi:hypothetical protein